MPDRADRFDQLTGAFDAPIAPSPAFAAHLRAQVVAELAASPHQIASTPNGRKEPIMLATVATPAAHPTRRLRQGTRKGKLLRPRWTRTTALLNVATILLLLLIGTGISLHFLGPNRGSPSTYQLPAVSSRVNLSGSPTPSPTSNSVGVQPGANPEQTNQYDVSVGTPKSMTTLGALISPDVTGGGVVNDGTLYRLRIPADTTTGKTWTVGAVSLTDGTTRTVFDDSNHDATRVLVHDGTLLVLANPVIGRATDASLAAIDTQNATPQWSMDLFAGKASGGPLLVGDRLFVADGNGKIYAIDLSKHRIAWTASLPSPGSPAPVMAADGGMLYVATGYDLTTLDQASGAARWQVDLSSRLLAISAMSVAEGHILMEGTQAVTRASTPAPSQNMNAGRVLGVSTRTHAVEWQYDAPDRISPPLIVTHGRVIIGQTQGGPFGDTVALDLATGKAAWQLKGALPVFADRDQVIAQTTEIHAEPRTTPATPITGRNNSVFVQPPPAERSITLLGINPISGTTQWVQGESIGNGGPTAFLPFDGGMVISISDGRVLVLRD